MDGHAPKTRTGRTLLALSTAALMAVAACAPTAAPSPTAAPAKPAPTAAPAKEAPAAKPTAAPAAKPAEKPAEKAAPKATEKPAAKPADTFFAGKTVRIITGFTPGGLFDGWSRMLAKHMPKHLPGNPSMVVENMPGAGSMTAANHIYKAAPKDGTVIGNFIQSQVLNQIRGVQGVEFDARNYQWLGAVASASIGCIARDETGVRSLGDSLSPHSKQVIMGTSAIGSTGYDYPVLMKHVLGANFKMVPGYPGNAEVRLAIEKGEVQGYCVAWEVLKPTLEPWKQAGTPKVTILVQATPDKKAHPEMKDVPILWDFIKNQEDRQLFELLMAPEQFYWPFALPPGTPMERVQVLRKAMTDAFKDPELKADADKAQWTYQGVPAEKIEQVIKDVMNTPEPIKKRFKEVLESEKG